MARLTITEPQVEDTEHGFDFFIGTAVYGGIVGGNGHIYGNRYWSEIVVISDVPGTIVFDSTFNTGSDIISLGGSEKDWTVRIFGSNAVFESIGHEIWIPIGNLTWITFDDNYTRLYFNQVENAFKLGPQFLDTEPIIPNTGYEFSDYIGREFSGLGPSYLYTNGSPVELHAFNDFQSGIKIPVEIIGTDGPDHVTAGGHLTFDASFNRGGDTIVLAGDASAWEAGVTGSRVQFTKPGSSDIISVPFGPNGLELDFADGDATLIYDTASGHVLIGDQIITVDPAPLHLFA